MARVRPTTVIFFAWLALALLHAPSFGTGWFEEDFSWLALVAGGDWRTLLPMAGGYYRPLAVNLPYLLFGNLAHGPALWAALAWLLVLAGAQTLYRWLRELAVPAAYALGAALLWLACPSQFFALYYRNAFDYVLFPLLTLLFLRDNARGRHGAAFLWFALACGTKEMAYALPLFFLPRSPRWFLAGAAFVALFLGMHSGLRLANETTLAGFTPAGPALEPLLAFTNQLVLGKTLAPGSVPWHALAWAWVGWGLARGNIAGIRAATARLWPALALFAPLFFLRGVYFEHLALVFFPLALAFAGVAARERAQSPWPAATLALAVAVAVSLSAPDTRLQQKDWSNRFHQVIERSEPALRGLKNCGNRDRVVTSGLENVFFDAMHAEHALWGLRYAHPGTVFYLLGETPDSTIAPHRTMWISEKAAQNLARLHFTFNYQTGMTVTRSGPPCRPPAAPSP